MHPRLKGVFFLSKNLFVPRKKKQNIPKRLRAYMFADRKSHSPEVAPSGVRHDIFVAFMTCFRYSRGSLSNLEVNESNKMTMRGMVGNSRHGVINVDTVFPFKLSPHTPELYQEDVSK